MSKMIGTGWVNAYGCTRCKRVFDSQNAQAHETMPCTEVPASSVSSIAETALLRVRAVVAAYLPPDGLHANKAMAQVVEIVDPWPLFSSPDLYTPECERLSGHDWAMNSDRSFTCVKCGWNQPAHATPTAAVEASAMPKFTDAEIKANPRLKFEPEQWVRRDDGQVIRLDRWEWGFRAIVSTLFGNRHEFEIPEVVEAVEALAAQPKADSTEPKPMQFKKGLCEQCGKLTIFQTCTECLATPSPVNPASAGDWFCEQHPQHPMGHNDCTGAGIPEHARIPMFVSLLKTARQEARESAQMRDDIVARVRASKAQPMTDESFVRKTLSDALLACDTTTELRLAIFEAFMPRWKNIDGIASPTKGEGNG